MKNLLCELPTGSVFSSLQLLDPSPQGTRHLPAVRDTECQRRQKTFTCSIWFSCVSRGNTQEIHEGVLSLHISTVLLALRACGLPHGGGQTLSVRCCRRCPGAGLGVSPVAVAATLPRPGDRSDSTGSSDGRTAPDHTRGASPGAAAAEPPGRAGHSPGGAQTAPGEGRDRRGPFPPQPRAGRCVRNTARPPRAPPVPQLRPSVSAAPPGGAAGRCPFKAAQPRAHSSGRVTVPGSGWRHAAIPPAVHPAAAGRAPRNKGGIKIEEDWKTVQLHHVT
ncbi:uncharacterized protein FYW23_001822 [Sylvia borin]